MTSLFGLLPTGEQVLLGPTTTLTRPWHTEEEEGTSLVRASSLLLFCHCRRTCCTNKNEFGSFLSLHKAYLPTFYRLAPPPPPPSLLLSW